MKKHPQMRVLNLLGVLLFVYNDFILSYLFLNVEFGQLYICMKNMRLTQKFFMTTPCV